MLKTSKRNIVTAEESKNVRWKVNEDEKYKILHYRDQKDLLNERSELVSKCRHVNKFVLANYKSND